MMELAVALILTALIAGGLVLLVLVTLDRWTARSTWGED